MSTPLEKVIKDLIKARWLLIDAEDGLNQLDDYVVDLEKMCYSIDKNLYYFRKTVKKVDEEFYHRFLEHFEFKKKEVID